MRYSMKQSRHNSLFAKLQLKQLIASIGSVLLLLNSYATVLADTMPTLPKVPQSLINHQLYGYDGQLQDPESGLQFLGKGYHRAYNPVTRRFMSQDTLSPFAKGGFNGYLFASNNPIMHQDPSGHMSSNFWLNIVAGIVGVVSTVLAPFSGGSSVAIGAAMLSGVLGTASGITGAVGEGIHNKALMSASPYTYIVGDVLDVGLVMFYGISKLEVNTTISNAEEISQSTVKSSSEISSDSEDSGLEIDDPPDPDNSSSRYTDSNDSKKFRRRQYRRRGATASEAFS